MTKARMEIGDIVERAGKTNNKFTWGKHYQVVGIGGYGKPCIINDEGMKSVITPSAGGNTYWEKIDLPEEVLDVLEDSTRDTCKDDLANTEENKMIKIETITYINGSKLKEVPEEDLIESIGKEKGRIQVLKDLGIDSPAFTKIQERHQRNINILVNELEKRNA